MTQQQIKQIEELTGLKYYKNGNDHNFSVDYSTDDYDNSIYLTINLKETPNNSASDFYDYSMGYIDFQDNYGNGLPIKWLIEIPKIMGWV